MLLVNLKLEYLHLSIFIVLSIILSVFLLFLSYSISKKKKNDVEKLSAYECGFDPFGSGVSSFEVHFYIVGILFIIFDLEIIFLYPWALHLGVLGGSGFYAIIVFLGILTVGFVYEWQKGALDWSKSAAIEKNRAPQLARVSATSLAPPAERTKIGPVFTELGVRLSTGALTGLVFVCCYLVAMWVVFSVARAFAEEGFILFVVLVLLLFASAKRVFTFRWTLLQKHKIVSWVLVLALVTAALSLWKPEDTTVFFHQQYTVCDFYTSVIKYYLIVCTIFFLIITGEYLLKYSVLKQLNLIEFPLVICFALFFMLLLVSSFNIFGAYISLEGVTFSLYILAGMNSRSQNALESGMKYFCLGAVSSGFLLFGVALIFIMTKTLDFLELRFLFNSVNELPLLLSFALIFFFFGFWFKLSIFPCHVWTPDVYEGVLTPTTLFFATVVKLGVFSFFVRVLFFLLGSKLFLLFWQPIFLFVAAGSIIFGAFGALVQTKIKRFVGYTSINQMGYLLIGVSSGDLFGLQSSFLYLFFYVIMGFSFFSILLYVNDFNTGKDILFINQLGQFGQKHRNLSVILALVLFSMAGIPPLAGFFGKFFLFFSAFKAGNHSLVVLGLVANVISTFYYLRLIKCMFFEELKSRGVYLFFVGFDEVHSAAFDLILGFFLFILLVSPIYLNRLLLVFEHLASSASSVIS